MTGALYQNVCPAHSILRVKLTYMYYRSQKKSKFISQYSVSKEKKTVLVLFFQKCDCVVNYCLNLDL